MIKFSKVAPRCEYRPPIILSLLQWSALKVVALDRWVRPSIASKHVGKIIESVKLCRDRIELERLLGVPQYCLPPNLFKKEDHSLSPPDRVETYYSGFYVYDVLFFVSQNKLEVFATSMAKVARLRRPFETVER